MISTELFERLKSGSGDTTPIRSAAPQPLIVKGTGIYEKKSECFRLNRQYGQVTKIGVII